MTEIPEEAKRLATEAVRNRMLESGDFATAAEEAILAALPHLRVQETPASDLANTAGLHGKYLVQKVRDPDGKHAECRYFVLDPQHDLAAADAVRFYASLVQASRRDLYDDLVAWLGSPAPPRQPVTDTDGCQGNQRGSGKACDCPACSPHPRPVVDREAVAKALHDHVQKAVVFPREWKFAPPVIRLEFLAQADAILALLPTEEGEGSTVCTCRTIAPSGWDTVQQVVDPRCPLHAEDATKALVEVGTKLGYELGRKEAGEEIAIRCEGAPHHSAAGRYFAQIARDLTSQPSGAAPEPLTVPAGHSDLPEGGEAAREACPEYYPVAITRMMCVKEAGHEDEHQTTGGVTWRNRYLTKGGQ